MPSAAGTLSPGGGVAGGLSKSSRASRSSSTTATTFPPNRPSGVGEDNWRVRLAMARLWVDAINRHGGDAQLVHLPDNRHPRQHPLPILGPEQCADRRPGVRVPAGQGPELKRQVTEIANELAS